MVLTKSKRWRCACRSETPYPFLDFKSFVAEESTPPELESRVALTVRSPFVSVYEAGEGEAGLEDPVRQAFSNLVNQLHDEEFDEASFELESYARGVYQELLSSRYTQHEAERLVSQRFSQLNAIPTTWWMRSRASSPPARTSG